MAATPEKRKFRISTHAIMTLIGAQAGSLQKAMLEAVANSQDAGATGISIELTPHKVIIQDDGKGFASKAEIDQFFDEFGFDHSKLDREVGRFGVGRGQLFSFGKNRWTTNEFVMDIDIEKNGLDYDMIITKKPSKGVKIEIELYNPLNASKMLEVEKEFRKLVLYSPLPVKFNGKIISKDPAKDTWDIETKEAWIRLTTGHELQMYSQGLFVQALHSYQFGKGGIVITKPGFPLKQNLARNDILRDKCPVWKAVHKSIVAGAAKDRERAVGGKAKVTDGMRTSLAMEAMGVPSDEALRAFVEASVITLTTGKHIRIGKMASFRHVAGGAENSPSADRLIQMEQACVVSPATLARFGVDDAVELLAVLKAQAEKLHTWEHKNGWRADRPNLWRTRAELDGAKGYKTMADLPMVPSEGFEVIKEKEWTPDEKVAMKALRWTANSHLFAQVHDHLKQSGHEVPKYPVKREIDLMVSETALACTDGSSHIWINRPTLNEWIKKGPSGFVALCHLLVHEMLHDFNSSSGHEHDQQFYEYFHNIALMGESTEKALGGYRSYLAHGGKAPSHYLAQMEVMEQLDSNDAATRQQAQTQAPDEAPVEPAAPKRGRGRPSTKR